MKLKKIDMLTPKDISLEMARVNITNYLNDISNWLRDKSLEGFPWSELRTKAEDLLLKINNTYGFFKRSRLNKEILSKSVYTKNKNIQKLKYVYQLQAYVTQGYIFIQKVREFISKEELQYLIMFDANYINNGQIVKTQKIGNFTLDDVLKTLKVRITQTNNFNIQLAEFKELVTLFERENDIDDKRQSLYNQIIELANKLQQARYEKVSKQRGAGESGYEVGQAGIAYEIAANKVLEIADAIGNPNVIPNVIEKIDQSYIDSLVEKFHADNAAFYQAGDLDQRYVVALFEKAKNVVFELKRVSVREDAVGARLTGVETVTNGLQKIINIVSDKNILKGGVEESLKKLFKINKDKLENIAADLSRTVVANTLNSTMQDLS